MNYHSFFVSGTKDITFVTIAKRIETMFYRRFFEDFNCIHGANNSNILMGGGA